MADVAAIPQGSFDIGAIRPGFMRAPPNAARARPARFWTWPLAFSFGLHIAALAAIVVWPSPAPDAVPPEAVAVEIVVETHPSAPATEPPPPTIAPHAADEATPLSAPLPPPPAVVEAPPSPASKNAMEPPAPPPPMAPTSPPPPAAVEAPPAAPHPPPAVVEPARPSTSPPTPVPTVPRPTLTPATKPPPPVHVKAPSERSKRVASREAPSEAPAAIKPQASAISNAEVAAYQSSVLGRISAAKRYPEAARDRESRGVAIVRFSITASGQAAGAAIAQSAGDAILDSEALATVRRASPFPPPPPGAPRTFSATLSYKMR